MGDINMCSIRLKPQNSLCKKVWIVFLCCIVWACQATAEFGISYHSEHDYSLHAFTFTYQEGYTFRPRVIVQYDPSFSGEERICAIDLYVNGKVCARLEKWSDLALPGHAEHRAEFRLDQYQSNEYVHELSLVPVWTEGADKQEERIPLQPEWPNSFGETSAYVQSEEANAAPIFDAPGSDAILLTLFNGVKLTAIGPQMQNGWVAVYVKTAQDELYGYIEGKNLHFDDDVVYSTVSQTQPVCLAAGSTLYTLHPPQSKIVTFHEPSCAIALGYGDDSVFVSTASGKGLVAKASCTSGQTPGQMKCSLLDERGFVINVEIQPDDRPMTYLLNLRLDYPEHYMVNDDIERFEVWINGERSAAAVCVSPYTLYCGKFKVTQAENTLLLVPKWGKSELYAEDAIMLPAFIP